MEGDAGALGATMQRTTVGGAMMSTEALGREFEELLSTNPFTIPEDETIFRQREQQIREKLEQRQAYLQAPVHEKDTLASRMGSTFAKDSKAFMKSFKSTKALATTTTRSKMDSQFTLAGSIAMPGDARAGKKENMTDFIQKKREIFLLQMSLDTKKAEIKKLDERTRQREEALKKSEQMLEEDALRFDAFLKENDQKVQEAIKRAEIEAKARQDRVMDIKRLNATIAQLRSELSKYEEQLEDCKRYKAFLDDITPDEWFALQATKKERVKAERTGAWQAACEAVRRRKSDAQAAKVAAQEQYDNARTQQEADGAIEAIKQATEALKVALQEKEPPPPTFDDLESEETDEMFYRSPSQLLQVFKALEESNLFMIQNAQAEEEVLDELRAKMRDTRARFDGEVCSLQAEVARLELQINAARENTQRLKERTIDNMGSVRVGSGSLGDSGNVTLEALTKKVTDVYVRCGFDADRSIGTILMLTNIEQKLEEYLDACDAIPKDVLADNERLRMGDRLKVAREEKLKAQKAEHQARVQRALERAAAPVYKKTGKQVMFRSTAQRRKVEKKADQRNDDELELEAYLAQEML